MKSDNAGTCTSCQDYVEVLVFERCDCCVGRCSGFILMRHHRTAWYDCVGRHLSARQPRVSVCGEAASSL
jgi:hypothetical protein